MPNKLVSTKRATDSIVVIILYTIVFIGAYLWLINALAKAPVFPRIQNNVTVALLAVPSAILFIASAAAAIRFIAVNKTLWGYRAKRRVFAAFLLTALLAAVPPTLFFSLIANRAVNAPFTAEVSSALDDSLHLVLAYYSEKEASLKYLAENEVKFIFKSQRSADAKRVLNMLTAYNPSICSVEIFKEGASYSFSGDATAQYWSSHMDRSGFLPRLSSEGRSYIRYYARHVGTNSDGERLSVIVSLRFEQSFENAAMNISKTVLSLNVAKQGFGSFFAYLGLFALCFAAPFLSLALLFATGAVENVMRPVYALSEALDTVGAGARRAPFLARAGDDTGELITKFNVVLEHMERTRADEIHSEKTGAWRDIARKLAHELRNPLTPIQLSAERVLKRWKSDPSTIDSVLEKSMVAIIQETANMNALLTEFRDFARLPEPQKDWMDVRATALEVIHLYSASYPAVSFDCDGLREGVSIQADRGYIKQAFSNLISNAADASAGKGHIWMRSDLVKTAESRYCRIQIRDDGCGIAPELRDKIFTPYVTTKAGGTGLGLAIVAHIISAHGGSIRFDSVVGEGTVFYIDLPANAALDRSTKES